MRGDIEQRTKVALEGYANLLLEDTQPRRRMIPGANSVSRLLDYVESLEQRPETEAEEIVRRRLEFIRDNLEPKEDGWRYSFNARQLTDVRSLEYTILAALTLTGRRQVIAAQHAEDLGLALTQTCRAFGLAETEHFAEVYRWLHDARHAAEEAAYNRPVDA